MALEIMKDDAQLEVLSKNQQKLYLGGRSCVARYCTCGSGDWFATRCPGGDLNIQINSCDGGGNPWDEGNEWWDCPDGWFFDY